MLSKNARTLVIAILATFGTVALLRSQDSGGRINKFAAGQQFTQILQGGPAANTTGTPAAGFAGTVALAAGAGTVTLPGSYTLAPVALCTDQTAANAVKCSVAVAAGVATITLAGTTTDVIAYVAVGNPN